MKANASLSANFCCMKNVFIFLLALCSSVFAMGQKPKSTLKIRLSDGQPLMITINGRDFRKINTLLTLNDVPGKRHSIQVYKYHPGSENRNAQAQLVFSGNIKIEPGNTYDCIVDVPQRKWYMKKLGINEGPSYQAPPPSPLPNAKNDVPLASNRELAFYSPRLKNTIDEMDKAKEDAKKLALAKAFLSGQSINSAEARKLADHIMFDDNKLEFLKTAYPSISDKPQFATLQDVFNIEKSRKDFLDFLKL